MKILITGGHLTPALAVIQALPKDAKVVYVGRKFGLEGDSAVSLEYQTITSMQLPFIVFQPGRLQRKFTRHSMPSLGRIPKGIWEAFKILKEITPDVVLSFGGYVAFPMCVAAAMLKIPSVLHEQTLEAGGANHLLSRFAAAICVSWESSQKFFPKEKVVLTGNPIIASHPSTEMREILAHTHKKYPLLTVTGGSLGSHPINELIESILPTLLAKYTIFHQTGDAKEFGDFARLQEFKSTLPYTFQERYIIRKFISPDDISFVYESSDMVVSRSGINTVLSLLLANTPSLLIPLPFSQRHEQEKNARLLQETGLGKFLQQENLTSDVLLREIEQMMEKRKTYTNVKRDQLLALHQHAAKKIIEIVYGTKNDRLQKKI